MNRQKNVVIGGKNGGLLPNNFNIKKFAVNLLENLKKVVGVFWGKFKKTGREYFENSSINCYQYIVDDTMENWERWVWRVVHAVATGVALWLLWVAGNGAILAPVATTRAPTDVPLTTVPHPAIAICPYNKISRAKATKLAETLIANKSLSYDVEKLVELLSYLGLSLDLEMPEDDEMEILHNILDPYNLETVMRDLAPTCDEILNRCIWRGIVSECSQIFTMRKTMEGFCCIFNYGRLGDAFLTNMTADKGPKLMAMSGQDRGLSVLLNPMLDDYLYTSLPNAGFSVLVFSSGDYPDMYSGGCYEVPTAPRTEVYLTLDAVSITSTSAVESLAPSTRGCLFESDKKKFVDSFSDCMLNCRLRNMHTTCGCLPFFAPFQFREDICDLTAIMCLKRWEDNWAQAWSGEDLLLENGEVAGKGLQPPCFFCLPSCEEAIYRPHQYTIPLQPESVNSQPDTDKAKIKKGIVFVDHIVLHVFFSKDSVVHLVHGLLFNWYDLLSSLGGLCGLVLGGSIISVVEIFYYFLGGPATKFRRPRQTEMRQLYWEELRNYKRK